MARPEDRARLPHHQAFGQRPCLVGAEDVHAPEVLDGREVTHQHAVAGHHLGTPSEVDAQDRGEGSGLRPTASATENNNVSMGGRPLTT